MRIPLQERGQSPMRSLDTLQRDYLRFCSEGKGSLKNAKHFNNVIGQPFFDIPLVQVHLKCMSTMYANVYMHIILHVCVIMLQLEPTLMHTHICTKVALPGLHISLGIFMKIWNLMERECHQLDLRLAQLTAGQTGDRARFLEYSALIHEISNLQEERERAGAHADMLDGAITTMALQFENSSSNPHIQELQQEAQRARGRTEELVHACLCILTQSTNNRCTDFCTMEYRNKYNIYT